MKLSTQIGPSVKLSIFLALSALLEQPLSAGPAPTVSCNSEIVPWTVLRRDNVVAQVKQAEKYYMNSSSPDAGQNLSERRANLAKEVRIIFTKLLSEREAEYSAVKCHYHGVDWNKAGKSS